MGTDRGNRVGRFCWRAAGGIRALRRRGAIFVGGVATGAMLVGCAAGAGQTAVAGGDSQRGVVALQARGCDFCHQIPGVSENPPIVGPPLADWAERRYIAGALPNTPANLVLWIMNPHQVEPGTAMPDLGVGEEEARDIAAYLFTLGDAGEPVAESGGVARALAWIESRS